MTRAPAPHPAVIWAVPAIAIGILVALLATNGNRNTFLAINAWSHATGPAPWSYLTVLGDTTVAIALFLPFALRRPDVLRALAVGAVLATLFVHGLKPLLAQPRPPLCQFARLQYPARVPYHALRTASLCAAGG